MGAVVISQGERPKTAANSGRSLIGHACSLTVADGWDLEHSVLSAGKSTHGRLDAGRPLGRVLTGCRKPVGCLARRLHSLRLHPRQATRCAQQSTDSVAAQQTDVPSIPDWRAAACSLDPGFTNGVNHASRPVARQSLTLLLTPACACYCSLALQYPPRILFNHTNNMES